MPNAGAEGGADSGCLHSVSGALRTFMVGDNLQIKSPEIIKVKHQVEASWQGWEVLLQ